MKKIEPVNDIVVIEKNKVESIFHLPEETQGTVTGLVIATGPGYRDRYGNFIETTVQTGDTVWFDVINGHAMVVNGETLYFQRERDLLCRGFDE